MLKTKSIQKRKHKSDGLRICIMRRIRPEYDFDMWLPKVAPSEKLLKEYVINKEINWSEFKVKFLEELRLKKSFLNFIGKASKTENITLLCWEEKPNTCHRRLVLEEISNMWPNIKTDLG